jgi:hypothetical protein
MPKHPECVLPHPAFFVYLFFETGSCYIAQAHFKLTMKFRLASNSKSSGTSFLHTKITGVSHKPSCFLNFFHYSFSKFWIWLIGLLKLYSSISMFSSFSPTPFLSGYIHCTGGIHGDNCKYIPVFSWKLVVRHWKLDYIQILPCCLPSPSPRTFQRWPFPVSLSVVLSLISGFKCSQIIVNILISSWCNHKPLISV